MEKPLISVIVPVYNAEEYIDKCIENLIIQTYGNIEIILVDDGSTDRSPQIIDDYSKQYENVIAVHQKNQGQGVARNKGLDIASGDYIGFMDDDDNIPADYYDILYKVMIETGADIVQGQLTYYDPYKNIYKKVEHSQKRVECDDKSIMLRSLTEKNLNGLMVHQNVWTKLIKRKLFDDVRFVKTRGEDCEILIRLFDKCDKLVVTNETSYLYAIRKNSDTTRALSKMDLTITDTINNANEYMKEHGYSEKVIGSVIHAFLYNAARIYCKCLGDYKNVDNEIKSSLRKNLNNELEAIRKSIKIKTYIKYKVIYNMSPLLYNIIKRTNMFKLMPEKKQIFFQ